MAGLILISMRAERAVFCHLKKEGECIERFGRAHPSKIVGAVLDFYAKLFFIFRADGTVDPICRDDEVTVSELLLKIRRINHGFKMQPNTDSLASFMQQFEQGLFGSNRQIHCRPIIVRSRRPFR